MSRYAADTSVSVERSKAQIEQLLSRYGADRFQSGWDAQKGVAVVMFEFGQRLIRFQLQFPSRDSDEIALTPTGKERAPGQVEKAWEQAQRQRWRALLLTIKAKLESIESGITDFDSEFLAHLVLPNGETVGENLVPKIQTAIEAKQTPRLLLPGAK